MNERNYAVSKRSDIAEAVERFLDARIKLQQVTIEVQNAVTRIADMAYEREPNLVKKMIRRQLQSVLKIPQEPMYAGDRDDIERLMS